MTESNIIELTSFRADLARSLTRRGERLLVAADLADEVATLEPLEAYYIIRELGLDQALPILRELSHEQLQACLDLDCWTRYDFSVENLDEWLAPFAAIDPETLAQTFLSLDYVLQLLFLTQSVTVYDPDTDQVPPEDETRETTARAMTPDGFYLLELKNPEQTRKVHPFGLLDAMYQYDPTATHRLMSEVRVDLPTQIEEEALRFRSGRMQDLGFADPGEASTLFSKPPSRQPMPRPQEPLDSPVTRLPSVYAAPLLETTLLQRALTLVTDPQSLSRLQQELVWAINSAIIAYGEKPQDIEQITDTVKRVRDTISLGLESLLALQEPPCQREVAEAAAKAAELLEIWPMTDLFRHGYGATMVLQEEMRQAMAEPRFAEWYNLADTEQSDEPADRLERAFVAGLLKRQPLRGGFDPGNAETVRAFATLAEVSAAQVRLKRLVDHFKK
ncbi:DUF6178 family protein [Thiovibrio frasassiensis]|uniref:DUF6178 family protein n=1 Tax=Thiovibrio frasassiensis TaxID=2984131 RepID=A0A9X4RK49_9BACT|nr:DUF6178 family protein [Thiovibrio frasassiensis]MDG4474711.1 DUF6178 family protein [Thiovibrio frasassiensis]